MDSQFLNQDELQNDLQTPNQSQQQPTYEQQMQQQQQYPTYEQQMQQQQQTQQQYAYQQPMIVVQVPVYSLEQLEMQEKIRTDQFGLLEMRKKLRLEIISHLILLSSIVMIAMFSFFQLIGQGSVSGISLTRFLSSEVYILNAAYITAVVIGVLAQGSLLITLFQVQKIRVDSICPFDLSLKFGVISGAFTIAIVFFLSTFWLMMSLSTYWLFFLFQAIVLIGAMVVTFRVIIKAEKIAKITCENNIQTVKKPIVESCYYEPISYKNEIRYLQK